MSLTGVGRAHKRKALSKATDRLRLKYAFGVEDRNMKEEIVVRGAKEKGDVKAGDGLEKAFVLGKSIE